MHKESLLAFRTFEEVSTPVALSSTAVVHKTGVCVCHTYTCIYMYAYIHHYAPLETMGALSLPEAHVPLEFKGWCCLQFALQKKSRVACSIVGDHITHCLQTSHALMAACRMH